MKRKTRKPKIPDKNNIIREGQCFPTQWWNRADERHEKRLITALREALGVKKNKGDKKNNGRKWHRWNKN